jgi:hypothetical protein
MKISRLIEMLAKELSISGDTEIEISVLSQNTSVELKICDVCSYDGEVTVIETEGDGKELKKKLKPLWKTEKENKNEQTIF